MANAAFSLEIVSHRYMTQRERWALAALRVFFPRDADSYFTALRSGHRVEIGVGEYAPLLTRAASLVAQGFLVAISQARHVPS